MLKAILIDSREPDWVKALTWGEVPITVTELPTGDAWLATDDATIIIERKTIPDLLASIADGRLFAQCAEMVKVSPWRYLVVCEIPVIVGGHYYRSDTTTKTKWTVRQVEGALATVQQLGVTVIRDVPVEEYSSTLQWLANRDRGPVRIERKREAIMASPAEKILMALPGIGPAHAAALLKEYQTAAWAVTALTDGHAAQVHRIGSTKCASARRAYGLDDEQILAVNLIKSPTDAERADLAAWEAGSRYQTDKEKSNE